MRGHRLPLDFRETRVDEMNFTGRTRAGFAALLAVVAFASVSPLMAQTSGTVLGFSGFGGFTTDPGGFDVFRDTKFDAAYHFGAALSFRMSPNVVARADVSKAYSTGEETTALAGEVVDFNRTYYGVAVEARFPVSGVTPYLLAGGGMVTVDRTAPSRNYKFSEVAGRLGGGLAVPLSDSSFEFFVEGSRWFYGRVSTGEGTQFDTSVTAGLTFVPDL
jgi:hypothetical protein